MNMRPFYTCMASVFSMIAWLRSHVWLSYGMTFLFGFVLIHFGQQIYYKDPTPLPIVYGLHFLPSLGAIMLAGAVIGAAIVIALPTVVPNVLGKIIGAQEAAQKGGRKIARWAREVPLGGDRLSSAIFAELVVDQRILGEGCQ